MDEEIVDQSVPEVEPATTAEPELEASQPGEETTEETEATEPTTDFEEVEYEGKRYTLPKELKEAVLRQADYTRKTQEVAEHRRQLETAQQQFQQTAQAHRQNLQAHAQLMALDQQLGQYDKVDFQAWSDQDPIEAQKGFIAFNQLRTMRDTLAQNVASQEQQRQLDEQRSVARQIEEGRKVLEQEIPGWSVEKAAAIAKYGVTQGFAESDMASVRDPRAVKVLHKAFLYDQMLAKATKAPPKPDAVPVPKVSGKAAVTKDPSKMSDKEFAEFRRRQIAQRN